jgi:hypothetical protein
MVTFTDIVKEQRQQGAGVFSSLGKAAGQRTLERIDPRNYLFKRSGLLTALFPGLKGYQAKGGSSEMKSSGASSSLGQTNLVIDKLDELKVVQQETAKNTLVLPIIARDMNVMRQNILKLVKLSGGKPSSRADSFFMSARDRESAYESRFGKKSPTSVSDKKAEKEKNRGLLSFLGGTLFTLFKGLVSGIFSLFASLIPSLLGLFTGLIGTIGKITGSILTSILGPAIRVLIGSLSSLFLPLLRVLGPIVVVIGAMKLAMEALNKIFEFFTGKSSKYATEKYDKNTSEDMKKLIDKEFQLESQKQYEISKKQIETGKTFLGLPLGAKAIEDAKKYVEDADKLRNFKMADDYQRYRRDVLGNTKKYSKGEKRPTFEEYKNSQRSPSSLNSTSMGGSLDSGSLEKAEEYLGRTMSGDEKDALLRAVSAESSMNSAEYANVMAVILNRARNSNKSIIDVLQEKNQFQSVTGTANNPGPDTNYRRGPNQNQLDMILESTNSLPSISKNLDAFTSANPEAYKLGTNIGYLDKLRNSGGKQIGQTVFAENQYSGGSKSSMTLASSASAMPNMNDMGKFLNQGSADFEAMVRDFLASSGMVNINNDSSTKVSTTNASQDGPPGSAYDSDMFTAMVDSAINYS